VEKSQASVSRECDPDGESPTVLFLAAMPIACVDMFAQLGARFNSWMTVPNWRTRGLLLERGVPPERAVLLSWLPRAPHGDPLRAPADAWEEPFRAFLTGVRAQRLVVYNHYRPAYRAGAVRAARSLSIPVILVERGPLASHYYFDPIGVGAEGIPGQASVWQAMCEGAGAEEGERALARWRKLQGEDVEPQAGRLSGAELRAELGLHPTEKLAFFPLQVENDIQLTHFSPWVRSMEQAVAAVESAAEKSGWRVLVKPHPRAGAVGGVGNRGRVVFRSDMHVGAAVEAADAVVTVNSSVGLFALMVGKPVVTMGRAIYTGKGLTLEASDEIGLAEGLRLAESWRPPRDGTALLAAFLLNSYLVRYPLVEHFARAASIIAEPERAVDRMLGRSPWPSEGTPFPRPPDLTGRRLLLLVAARGATAREAERALRARFSDVEIRVQALPEHWWRSPGRSFLQRGFLGAGLARHLLLRKPSEAVIAVVDDMLLAPRAVRWALMLSRAKDRWWWCPGQDPIKMTWRNLWEREVGDWLVK